MTEAHPIAAACRDFVATLAVTPPGLADLRRAVARRRRIRAAAVALVLAVLAALAAVTIAHAADLRRIEPQHIPPPPTTTPADGTRSGTFTPSAEAVEARCLSSI